MMNPLLRYLSKGSPEVLMNKSILSQHSISLRSITDRILADELVRAEWQG